MDVSIRQTDDVDVYRQCRRRISIASARGLKELRAELAITPRRDRSADEPAGAHRQMLRGCAGLGWVLDRSSPC